MSFTRENPAGWSTGDKITAAQINGIDRDKALAVDGANGGAYTLAAKLSFQGTGGVEFAGTGNGLWPLLSSRTVTRRHSVRYELATDATKSTIIPDPTSAGSPYVIPALHIANDVAQNYTWIRLDDLPDGGTLNNIVIVKRWTNGGASPTVNTSTYDVVRSSVSTSAGTQSQARLISTGPIADDQPSGTYAAWSTYDPQTLTCDQNNAIDTATYKYFLVIKHFTPASSDVCDIISVVSNSTVTQLRW